MKLLLDTGPLGQLCHPRKDQNRPISEWLARLLRSGDESFQVSVPEIADYELRRKLLHLIDKGQATEKSVQRLDDLGRLLDYLPLDTETMRRAAELWAEAREQGWPAYICRASFGWRRDLAAQADLVGATVVTTNRKHLLQFVPAKEWTEISISNPASGS